MAGEHAQIVLRRTGGLAGVPTEAKLDTRELAPEQAQEMLGALESVDLAGIGKAKDWPPGAADTFHYEMKVEHEKGATHTASFSDRQIPPELAPVVRTLMERAEPVARGK